MHRRGLCAPTEFVDVGPELWGGRVDLKRATNGAEGEMLHQKYRWVLLPPRAVPVTLIMCEAGSGKEPGLTFGRATRIIPHN